jgi:uncharacterized protein YbjT (DUF2867 family)
MYVITGASGNSGHVVAEKLLAKQKNIRVIGRSADRLQRLTGHGAEAFVCDVTEKDKLAEAFRGAQAAYLMIPPNATSENFRGFQDRVSDAMAAGVREAGVKYVVVLSSFGADKSEGTGPVVGLHNLEHKLNAIDGLNALYIRAGYFMENTLAQIGIIKSIGVGVGPLRAELELPMIATRDIGDFAADALLDLKFSGKESLELHGQRNISMAEVTSIVGAAISRPHLSYKQLPDAENRRAMLEMGMSEDIVGLILEMAHALNSGHMAMLQQRSAKNTTPTSYETFVKEVFAPAFKGKPASAQ